jgi:hypothetical protein
VVFVGVVSPIGITIADGVFAIFDRDSLSIAKEKLEITSQKI